MDVDAKNRLLYFQGNGREPGEEVYYNHLYRVRFDGTDLTLLDPSDVCFSANHEDGCRGANHSSYLSPSHRYVVTTCSRVDCPYMSYVLDEKGKRVMDLERTDLTALKRVGWKLPETFSVKAADGVTDLYGNMWKPFDFDPKKKYPIIAHVYPGPQTGGRHAPLRRLQQRNATGPAWLHRDPGRPSRRHAGAVEGLPLVRLLQPPRLRAGRQEGRDRGTGGAALRSSTSIASASTATPAAVSCPPRPCCRSRTTTSSRPRSPSSGNHDNNIYNDNWSERYHGLKEVPADAADKDGKEERKTIRKSRPWDDEDDPDDKKADAKSGQTKDGVKKVETKKADNKKVAAKKAEAKKDVVKKDTAKKAEAKKANAKSSEVKKGDVKKDNKTEVKKTEPPKVKFEIKVPTNEELAANLKGHLLLVHGDMDNNVHPANTMRLVNALIKANKRFDMLILPGKRARLRRHAAVLHAAIVGLFHRVPVERSPGQRGCQRSPQGEVRESAAQFRRRHVDAEFPFAQADEQIAMPIRDRDLFRFNELAVLIHPPANEKSAAKSTNCFQRARRFSGAPS